MGPGQSHAAPVGMVTAALSRQRDTALPAHATANSGWDARLPAGLRLPRMPVEMQARQIHALGEVGVEAEFFLRLLRDFPGGGRPTHTHGTAFLGQLEVWARRLIGSGGALEIATQGYLAALEAAFPGVRAASAQADVWWPALPPLVLGGESVEMRLRRCGFAYRHVVAAHLTGAIEPIAEHLAQVLQALHTLPPAGVLPAVTLYQGLSELTSAVHGYLIPHHILGRDTHTPGLLPGIAYLRQLDAGDDTSLASDLAWAHAQYTLARSTLTHLPRQRPTAYQRVPPGALREWQTTIASLETLTSARTTRPSHS
ncbi:MAG: hypothetical protein ACHQ4H_10550 [Ktedonobacterales bacterium]